MSILGIMWESSIGFPAMWQAIGSRQPETTGWCWRDTQISRKRIVVRFPTMKSPLHLQKTCQVINCLLCFGTGMSTFCLNLVIILNNVHDSNTCICEPYLHNKKWKYPVSHSALHFFFPHMRKVSQWENFMAYSDMLHNLMKITMWWTLIIRVGCMAVSSTQTISNKIKLISTNLSNCMYSDSEISRYYDHCLEKIFGHDRSRS